MPKMPKSMNEAKYHEKNTLKGESGREVNRSIVDDIFLTRHCTLENTPNNAKYYDAKWWFDFPDSWYNQHSVNKAIGLRRITVHPLEFCFEFPVTFFRLQETTKTKAITVKPWIQLKPQMNIEECLTAITSCVNHELDEKAEDNDWVKMMWLYSPDNMVKFTFRRRLATGTTFSMQLDLQPDSHFWGFMNTVPDASYNKPIDIDGDWTFLYVWNRRDLYIHGSFVNYTKFHYLGRNDEFYPKPSKIYSFDDFQAMQFYFEVSYDAMRPVRLFNVDFEVELAFIIDAKKYQSE
jgi:hypothetical protein